MEYITLLLASVCFTGQFAFTKLFERGVRQTVTTSLVMVAISNLVGAAMYFVIGGFSVSFSPASLFWETALALVTVPYYVIGIKVLSLGSLAIYSMFMMLGGMLVPFLYGLFTLGEEITVGKTVGIVLLSIFIILQAVWQSKPDEKSGSATAKERYLFFALCIVIFILNGLTGVIAKAHQLGTDAVEEVSFTASACAITSMISGVTLLLLALFKKESRCDMRASVKLSPLLNTLFIGAFAYTGSFLHLKAAAVLEASIQFPLVSGVVILLSAFCSFAVFREKISAKEWISVAGACASTVLFAF